MSNQHASNRRMTNPHHDSSIDAAVISEFNRRFPALAFISFYRNCSSRPLHVINFAGQYADLVAAGIPVRADLKKSTGAPDQLWWYVTRDRRRKAGMLVANVRLEGVLPADHPMAWLEPRNWTSRQGARGASAQWTSADLAAAAKAWADTYGRREKVTQAQPTHVPQAVEPVMTAGTVLRHEHFERAPMRPQKRRRGPLPRGVVSIRGRRVNLRVGDRAELVGYTTTYAEDNGKRVRIVDVDVGRGWIGVRSLDGPLRCDNGGTTTELDVRATNLRRVWTGLTENERIQLRLLRGAS
jgi:hypothetical protein